MNLRGKMIEWKKYPENKPELYSICVIITHTKEIYETDIKVMRYHEDGFYTESMIDKVKYDPNYFIELPKFPRPPTLKWNDAN